MKPKDIKFPIEVEINDGEKVYKIEFLRRTWIKWCCKVKAIDGRIKSRTIPKVIEGFEPGENKPRWETYRGFSICPHCGKFNYLAVSLFEGDVIRKAWLEIVRNTERRHK